MKIELKGGVDNINWNEVQLLQHKTDKGIVLVQEGQDKYLDVGCFAGTVVVGYVENETVGFYAVDWDKDRFQVPPSNTEVILKN